MSLTAYTVLGVEPTATHEQIVIAYRAKAMKHHPDHGGDARKMAQINLAWQRIGNPEERAKYDRKLVDLSKVAATHEHAAEPAETSAADDISIDAFLGRMRDGNLGVAVAEVARQHGLVDQPGFARVQMAANKAGEVSKGLVDLIGLVRGR